MEIQDYLKVLGKRAWLLVMIPAVAGVVAGLIAVQQPQAFRTTATLQLPRDGATSAPALVAQQVADFKAAAGNATVQNQVSRDTGIPVKKIKKLKLTQVGDSSQLTMGMQDKKKDPSDSRAVIIGMASGALKYLQAPDLANAQKAVDAATAQTVAAQTAINNATTKLNVIYASVNTNTPEDDIKNLKSEILDFTSKYYTALGQSQTLAAAIFKQRVDQDNLQIIKLSKVLPDVQAQQAIIDTSTKALDTAQTDHDTAAKALAAITSAPDLTFSAEGTAVVRKTRVVKTAAAAVVAGFPLAIGIVLLLDALQRRRQARQAARAERQDLPPGDDDTDALVAEAPAVIVGSRASPAPAQVEPAPNGVAPHVPVGEPALLVGAMAAAAATEDDDDVDDDLPDGNGSLLDDNALELDQEDIAVDEEDDELAEVDALVLDEDDAELDKLAPLALDEDDELDKLAPLALDEDDELDKLVPLDLDEDDELAPVDATALDEDDDLDEAEVLDEDAELLDEDAELLDEDAELLDDEDLEEAEALDDDALGEDDEEDDAVHAAQNGRGREPARVPDAEEAFDDDDEGHDAGT